MSKPAFEIKGGWLRVNGYRIRISAICRYSQECDDSCWINQTGNSKGCGFELDGLVEALDAWFEREGEVKRIIGSGVRIDNDGNEREFVVDDKGNEHYYTDTSKGLAT